MRYLMMVKADDDYEAGRPPDPRVMAAVGKHAQAMAAKGILLEQGGLYPSAHGAMVEVANGVVTVIDGPFAETKELVGGYAILKAESREHAIALGREFMQLHADVLGPSYTGRLEIRRLADGPVPAT
jgi:hypothetical protein